MIPRVTVVRAPNPSPMTLNGTNSYLLCGQDGEAICIDPGPLIESHVTALLSRAAETSCRITLICLTHDHPDHAPAARALREKTGAPIAAHSLSRAAHDRDLNDGHTIRVGVTKLTVAETPGHSHDSICFYESAGRALFTGDTVLGEGYVLITASEGDMSAYMTSLQRLLRDFPDAQILYGGHGEPVEAPRAKLQEYLEHRRAREKQILNELSREPRTSRQLVASIYAQTDRALWDAAEQQLLAHLAKLESERHVRADRRGSGPARYVRA